MASYPDELYLTKMPEMLRLRTIGTTMSYILGHEMKSIGFISQEIIDELFKKYTNICFDDACKSINTTPKEFLDEHYSEMFKNCYPHGLARLDVINKPVKEFGGFKITVAPVQQPIAAAAAAPLLPQDDSHIDQEWLGRKDIELRRASIEGDRHLQKDIYKEICKEYLPHLRDLPDDQWDQEVVEKQMEEFRNILKINNEAKKEQLDQLRKQRREEKLRRRNERIQNRNK